MTSLDTGTYGAKVQSWKRANPRDLLKRLIEEQPRADKETLFKAFRDQVRGDDGEDFLDSIIEYWFANNYHSLTERPSPAPSKAAKRARVEEIKATIKARAAKMILLDMVLPNGKPLRDCTGRECAKAGGWFTKIAGQVKSGDIVGKVMSETQVRKLYSNL